MNSQGIKKSAKTGIPVLLLMITLFSCNHSGLNKHAETSVRPLKDTIGFAQYPWQMDSIMGRIKRSGWRRIDGLPWKFAICPHDDYTYVGKIYPDLLQNVKAPNLILIGVAHKAAQMGIRDSLVFDSYREWKGPWKNIRISPVREEIFSQLKGKYAVINDSLQKVEHSVEAMIPFLQYFNRDVSIISILVPSMSPDRMQDCGKALAEAIRTVAKNHNWEWGKDFAVVVTTDAVHYGNEDWGGLNRAYYGCDEKGNEKARKHEAGIIDSCLSGDISPDKIRLFNALTLDPGNFREYKWTWCGRYSVPVAMYTAYYLNDGKPLAGSLTGYSTSITSPHIPVDDLRMGRTAIATMCHWVGYAALGYSLRSEEQSGLVTLSVVNLRKSPEHESELVSQATMGTPFIVLEQKESWVRVQTPDRYTGWVIKSSVKLMNPGEMDSWKKAERIIYTDNIGWLYEKPVEKGGVVSDLVGGSILVKEGSTGEFFEVSLPDGRKGYIRKEKAKDFEEWRKSYSATAESIIELGESYMGVPYLWGGTSPKGVDCSGFVQSDFFRNGIILERDASLQAKHGFNVDITNGFTLLKKGDLLFFGSKLNGKPHVTHVAIYIGNNDYINSSGRVRINSLDSTKSDYDGGRFNSLLMAKRIIGVNKDEGIIPVREHPWY